MLTFAVSEKMATDSVGMRKDGLDNSEGTQLTKPSNMKGVFSYFTLNIKRAEGHQTGMEAPM